MLPVPTGGKLALPPKVVDDGRILLLVVEGGCVPPLALAGDKRALLSVSVVDGHIPKSAIAERNRGLLLA